MRIELASVHDQIRAPAAWIWIGLAGVGSALLVQLGQSLSLSTMSLPVIWPAAGWALALLLLTRTPAERWIVTLGVGAGSFVSLLTSANWLHALILASGEVVQALFGWWWLVGRKNREFELKTVANLVDFCALGSTLGPIVGTLAVVILQESLGLAVDRSDPLESGRLFLRPLSAMLGILLATPLVYELAKALRRPRRRSHWIKAALLFTVIGVLTAIDFALTPLGHGAALGMACLPLAFLVFAATRFWVLGAALSATIVEIISIVATQNGFGPMVVIGTTLADRMVGAQTFLAIGTICALVLGVALEERATSERRLIESEAIYRSIFDQSRDAIVLFDPSDLTVLEANQRACDLYGLTREQLIGASFLVLTPDTESSQLRLAEFLRSGRASGFTTAQRGAAGQRVMVDVSASLVDYKGRRVIMTFNRDVTDRIYAENERRQLEERLWHTQKLESLGVMASGVAHDFNNLLVSMLGHAEIARTQLPAGTPARDSVLLIEQAALRAAELTRQMLVYAGKSELQLEPVKLRGLVEETTELLRASITRSATIEFDLASSLPPTLGDATQLRQVVMNLITNASDAIGERVGKIRIRTGVVNLEAGDLLDAQPQPLPPGEYISLEVVDDGHGMDESTIKRIFEPFYSTRFAGRGLGLASVLGILKQHRGAVRVKSVVGVGTSMQILLPVYREVRAIASEDPSRTATPAPPTRASIGTILVVDDEPQVRELLERVLSAQGYRVLTACDGEEALRVVEQQVGTIDLVLLDLVMPRLSGELVLATLRSYYKQLPVIVMSGHTERETLQNVGRKANAVYLGKPFKLAVLLDAVRREVLRT